MTLEKIFALYFSSLENLWPTRQELIHQHKKKKYSSSLLCLKDEVQKYRSSRIISVLQKKKYSTSFLHLDDSVRFFRKPFLSQTQVFWSTEEKEQWGICVRKSLPTHSWSSPSVGQTLYNHMNGLPYLNLQWPICWLPM